MSQTLDRLLCEMHRERLHSTRDLGLLLYVARCGGRAEFWAVERASGVVPHLVAQTLENLEVYGLVKLTRTVSERLMIDIVELAGPGWDRVTELTAVIIGEIDRAASRGRWPFAKPDATGAIDLTELNARFSKALKAADQVNATNNTRRA